MFFDIGIILIVATAFAFLAKFLRQPLIPAYILTGLLLGPILGMITNKEVIATLSEIGVAFLLFIVGLEIDIRKLKKVGMVATLGGIIQVVFIFTFAFIASILLGFIAIEAVYLAILIALSSTMVVIKLLSDKKELDTLHGKIIVGVLLLQDLVAIIVLSVLTTIGDFSFLVLYLSILKGILIIAGSIIIAKYTFPLIFNFAAKSQELLFISAVSISLLYSLVFAYFDFSIAIGAFIAGVSLANVPYNIEIIGKVKPLRDFFAVLFFASLGMNLVGFSIHSILMPLIILIGLVILIKPVVIMFTTSFFGYPKRVSFLTAIYLAQISEFSLIIVSQGLLLGHISQEIFSVTVLLAVITITITTYAVKFQNGTYRTLSSVLTQLDRLNTNDEKLQKIPRGKEFHTILCGYNRIGIGIVQTLRKLKKKVLVVDYHPGTVRHLLEEKTAAVYGDIGDAELLDRLPLKKSKLLISSIPTKADNILLIKKAKKVNEKIIIIVSALQVEDAFELYDAGADYVVIPHLLGGSHVSLLIEDFNLDVKKIIRHKMRHLNELKEHKNIHPHLPNVE